MWQAIASFRCISWEVLAKRQDTIVGGGPEAVEGVAEDLHLLSVPCQVSECDAFWSHSWHGPRWAKIATEWRGGVWRDLYKRWNVELVDEHAHRHTGTYTYQMQHGLVGLREARRISNT